MNVYESMTPAQRTERARTAANAAWDNTTAKERAERTSTGRAKFMDSFESDEERAEHFREMAARSAKVRRPEYRVLSAVRHSGRRGIELSQVIRESRVGRARSREILGALADAGLVLRASATSHRWTAAPPIPDEDDALQRVRLAVKTALGD